MKGLTASQLALLNQLYAEAGAGTIPGTWLVDASITASKLVLAELDARYASQSQGSSADSALQPGDAATPTQGAKADTALQPTDNITNLIAGLSAATLVSIAQTAFGWGNHATAGYQTATPMKLYQTTAAGGAPEDLTLPDTPLTGTEVIVFVEQDPKHYNATNPPAAGDFYRSGTTVRVATTAGDRVSIYYTS